MIEFAGHGILLDIEGTTSSVSFVYDIMFPYARRNLADYLSSHWGSPALNQAVELIAKDAGHATFADWRGDDDSPESAQQLVCDEVIRLMDGDVKVTGLKQLQGLIWKAGFESGEMQAHVYDDVVPAIRRWCAAGRDVRIYSSGSIQAQKLFFGHTEEGDLLDLFKGHYDTTTGPKKESASYTTISADFQMSPSEILFLSDVPAELDAARTAGLQTALCSRPGNADVAEDHGHPEIKDFSQIELTS